jgi:predicted tellurium resistance membrane protein TerC
MSAPNTNVEKQEKRHRPSLWGIKGAMIFGALMLLGLIGFNMMNADNENALTNTGQAGKGATVVDTDVYAPGTNSSSTPTATD